MSVFEFLQRLDADPFDPALSALFLGGETGQAKRETSDLDSRLERLWDDFSDVPMDSETECICDSFLGFPAGTHREEIWKWFDERHSRGVYYRMYEYGGTSNE